MGLGSFLKLFGTKIPSPRSFRARQRVEKKMGRYLLLFMLGVPVPVLVLIWLLGGLH